MITTIAMTPMSLTPAADWTQYGDWRSHQRNYVIT